MHIPGTFTLPADAATSPHDAIVAAPPSLTQLAVEAAAHRLDSLQGDVDTAIACKQVHRLTWQVLALHLTTTHVCCGVKGLWHRLGHWQGDRCCIC